jgi:uncharacterized protein
MIHPFIENKLLELSDIFKNHRIKRVYLFGSACTEAFNDKSDIDLLIETGDETDPVARGENLWNLYYALKHFLGRDVDIITRETLTNKYFIAELNRTSVPIYG